MMLLYVCPTCGHWQDQSLAVSLGNAFAAMAQALTGNNPVQTPATTVECSACHAAMTQVQPTDRLFAWKPEEHDSAAPMLYPTTGKETVITDEATGVVITLQPGTPEPWRAAWIKAFKKNGEDEPK